MILFLKVKGVGVDELARLHSALSSLKAKHFNNDLALVVPEILNSSLEKSDDPKMPATYAVELKLTPRSGVGGRPIVAPESYMIDIFKALRIFPHHGTD